MYRPAAAFAALAALLCACEAKPKPGSSASATAVSGSTPAQPGAAAETAALSSIASPAGEPLTAAIDLPPAQPAQPVGTVMPAPWLAGAERVAAVAHGGTPYVIAAGTGWLRVFRPRGQDLGQHRDQHPGQVSATEVASAPAAGSAHVLEVLALARAAGSASEPVIAVGRGLGREARDAQPSVILYRFDGRALSAPESVPLPPTTRAQIIGIAADPGRPGWLWIGMFESKYTAVFLGAERQATGAWTTMELGRARVPLALAVGDVDGDGATDLLVARPYGEDIDAPGDVFILRPSPDGPDRSARTLLPSTRGARALVIHGRDVLYADGWHREYGRKANALITRARWTGRTWQREILAHVAGRYGYDRLRMGDIDGNGAADIIAAGNGPAVWIPGTAQDEQASEPAASGRAIVHALGTVEAMDVAALDIDGNGNDEVILIGPEPGIWHNGR